MDRNRTGTLSPKLEPNPKQLSAFEMAISLKSLSDLPHQETAIPKAGELCPQCRSVKIDYDNMLNLSCPNCHYTLAGCFT